MSSQRRAPLVVDPHTLRSFSLSILPPPSLPLSQTCFVNQLPASDVASLLSKSLKAIEIKHGANRALMDAVQLVITGIESCLTEYQ